MRKRLVFVNCCLLALLGAGAVWLLGTPIATGQGFEVQIAGRSVRQSDGRTFEWTKMAWYKGDGTAMAELHNTPMGQVLSVSDQKAGYWFQADLTRKNHSTRYYRDGEMAELGQRRTGSNRNCEAEATAGRTMPDAIYLGAETFLGYQVHVWGSGEFMAGKERYDHIVKYAPDLHCFAVLRDNFSMDNGRIVSHFTETATRISPGEPEAARFQPPFGSQEMAPTPYFEAMYGKPASEMAQCTQNFLKFSDEIYSKRQAYRR
jgi:hypothetical protein